MFSVLTTLAAAKEESSSFLVSPNVGVMIWTFIVFALSMFALYKLAFPKIQENLDKRQRAIEESIEIAERSKREADALLAEYRERLAAARKQADEIVARARKTGETTESEAVADAKHKAEELLAGARRDIGAEQARALREVRGEVANLTVLATEKVTRKSLTEPDQQRLVEEALNELDFATLAGDRD